MVNYTQAGGIATKRLQLSETGAGPLNFDAQYTYDGEGKITSVTYPTTYGWNGNTLVPTPGPTYTYSFDTMSRPIGLTDANNNSLVGGVSYGPANELLASRISTRSRRAPTPQPPLLRRLCR